MAAAPRLRLADWHIPVLAGATSGVALSLAFPSVNVEVLAWVALAPLFAYVAQARRALHAAIAGYAAGIVFFALSCPWIYVTVRRYGELSAGQAGVVFLLFLLLMGAYPALFGVAGYWLGRRTAHRLLPLPFAWVAVEWLRTYTPMGGFPWNLLGYSQADHAGFMLSATVAGIYGGSFLIAAVNALLASLWLRFRAAARGERALRPAAAAWEGIGLLAILGFATLPYHPPTDPPSQLHARMVQPDTSLDADWSAASLRNFLAQQVGASTRPGPGAAPQLVLWPEQPAPLDFDLQPDLQQAVVAVQEPAHAALLFGEITYAPTPQGAPDPGRLRNSALLVEPDGTAGARYDKLHLVPFGEYVPLPDWVQRLGGVHKLVQGVGDFVPGQAPVPFELGGRTFGGLICYESIFPELARREVRAGAAWLVILSDDGWYGRSSAQAQGLAMARVRAIEMRRWVLRDTNDGVTAAIDPYGRVTSALPPFQPGVLDVGFSPVSSTTFYERHGDWLPLFCTAVALGMFMMGGVPAWRRRRKTAGGRQ